MVWDKLGSSTIYDTAAMLWVTLHSCEVMEDFYKHDIKRHPSITSVSIHFLSTANIYEPLQKIYHMKRDINVLSTKSEHNYGRLTKI